MRKGYLYVLISLLMLFSFAAVAGEPEQTTTGTRTLQEKKDRAYELRYATKSDERRELFALINDIGPEGFFERFADDQEELLKVFKQLLTRGPSTIEESMVRADLAAYLLKDKRPSISSEAVTQITRMSLYANKMIVSDTLYDMYKAAANDDELRGRVAKALVLVGSNDTENKAPRAVDPDEYEENLVRFKEMLGDKSAAVRRAVVENLPRTLGTMAKVELGKLEADPDPGVRAAVIDFYREAKIKTAPVCQTVMKALGTDNVEELDKAIEFCKAMKLYEAREAMFAALKRHAGNEGNAEQKKQLRALSLRMIDLSGELGWTVAVPDLVWIYQNDTDAAIQNRAAYVILSLSGSPNVRLGGEIEEPFPPNMVEAERKALMLAFKAWLLSDYEKQGETAEVKRLREEAQIEFSDKIYDIAKARILDTDVANKRRGLKLVVDAIGPEEFAKEVSAEEFPKMMQSLQDFWQHGGRETDVNRHIARMVLPFTMKKDAAWRMNALGLLQALAAFCDKDVFGPLLEALRSDPDAEFAQAVTRVIDSINQNGYSGAVEREKEKRREEREKSKSESKSGEQ